ncbi:hypothetical protein ON010_g13013 [Phytophthora cinnamomi]|nr:hypothetical protein ON010_g13013 [Phytophthora cinnamomi]
MPLSGRRSAERRMMVHEPYYNGWAVIVDRLVRLFWAMCDIHWCGALPGGAAAVVAQLGAGQLRGGRPRAGRQDRDVLVQEGGQRQAPGQVARALLPAGDRGGRRRAAGLVAARAHRGARHAQAADHAHLHHERQLPGLRLQRRAARAVPQAARLPDSAAAHQPRPGRAAGERGQRLRGEDVGGHRGGHQAGRVRRVQLHPRHGLGPVLGREPVVVQLLLLQQGAEEGAVLHVDMDDETMDEPADMDDDAEDAMEDYFGMSPDWYEES